MDKMLVQYMALIAACQARIEAMKALNEHRRNIGAGQAYGEDAFLQEADELGRIVDKILDL